MEALTNVVVSERLGPLGVEERRIASRPATSVRSAPLWSTREIADHAAGADVVMIGSVEPFDAAAIAMLGRCQGIVRRGIGWDNIDADAATAAGILVVNVPDASVDEVAEHALAMLLALERRVFQLDRLLRAGVGPQDSGSIDGSRDQIRRISELTLAIVGFGRIGRALARRAIHIYGRILAVDPTLTAETAADHQVIPATLADAARTAHHVSLHTPLQESTRHIIDGQVIGLMQPGTIVVNTARGGLIDEAALAEALLAGHLGGAGLDVTEQEPLSAQSPLLRAGAVVTGHSASWSRTSRPELVSKSVEAVLDILDGRTPSSVVNPRVLTSPNLRLGTRT